MGMAGHRQYRTVFTGLPLAALVVVSGGCTMSHRVPHSRATHDTSDVDATQGAASAPALRDEILAMMAKDQELRTALTRADFSDPALIEELAEIDRLHTARMREIVAEHGFPTRRLVGPDGARAAWLLVQHADHDVAFQRMCLTQMDALMERGEASRSDVAYLTDRVLVNEGRPQRFGTQFHTVDGKLQPRPMEDPERIEERRRTMGLSTMKEYLELMHS